MDYTGIIDVELKLIRIYKNSVYYAGTDAVGNSIEFDLSPGYRDELGPEETVGYLVGCADAYGYLTYLEETEEF